MGRSPLRRYSSYLFTVQETVPLGTGPSLVAGVNVQLTVSTTGGSVPAPCRTSITALVKDRSVMSSVQLELGHPGAPGIGVVGSMVVTRNDTLPFLICESGIACEPETVTGAGFCPGG